MALKCHDMYRASARGIENNKLFFIAGDRGGWKGRKIFPHMSNDSLYSVCIAPPPFPRGQLPVCECEFMRRRREMELAILRADESLSIFAQSLTV